MRGKDGAQDSLKPGTSGDRGVESLSAELELNAVAMVRLSLSQELVDMFILEPIPDTKNENPWRLAPEVKVLMTYMADI